MLQGGMELGGDKSSVTSGTGSTEAYEPSLEAEPSTDSGSGSDDTEAATTGDSTQLARLREITARVAAENNMQIPYGTDAYLKKLSKTSKVPSAPGDLKPMTVKEMNENESGEPTGEMMAGGATGEATG